MHTIVWSYLMNTNKKQNLNKLSDDELVENTKALCADERELTMNILWHLKEMDVRRLFARRGYSSLWEYCTRELKYSDGAAYRRVAAMRLLKELPQVEQKIADGSLSLTNAATLQSFLRAEKKVLKKVYSAEEKVELLTKIAGKSTRECQTELRAISPLALPRESTRVLSAQETSVNFVAKNEFMKNLQELKNLASHQLKGMGNAEIFEWLLNDKLKLLKAKKMARPVAANSTKSSVEKASSELQIKSTKSTSAPRLNSRYISASVRRNVWQRDHEKCTYKDKKTGKRCCSQHYLQIDHCFPFALGGKSEESNLRLLCYVHNRLAADDFYGAEKMNKVTQ